MSPPLYRDCVCGHRGAQHRADGSCARCDCKHFARPKRVYAVEAPAVHVKARTRTQSRRWTGQSHPTRDSL